MTRSKIVLIERRHIPTVAPNTLIIYAHNNALYIIDDRQQITRVTGVTAITGSTGQFGNVTGGNYSEFETDGTLELHGNATTWEDLSAPLNTERQGAGGKPDYDFTNLGLLFPQNDDAEIAYLIIQMQHQKLLESDIKLHVHYIQSVAAQPTFKIDYRWYNNSSTVPGSWTTISSADGSKGLFSWSSGSILQIATFPTVSALTGETVSSNIDIKLYRDDNDVTGDVLAKYVDLHYQVDSFGSREEFSK